MQKIDLLTRAKWDLEASQAMLSMPDASEKFLDISAYHLQQSIEKTMKYVLAQNGIEFLKTHDIERLCKQFLDNELELPDWIFDNATLLTNYATQTRYGDAVLGVRKRIVGLQAFAEEFIGKQEDKNEQF